MRERVDRQGEATGTFDTAEFADELARAPQNHEIGTTLWFANESIRVFEVKLEPGERGPFHIHDCTYFWTCIEAGRGLQRFGDGSCVTHSYEVGETKHLVQTPDNALIHDLENVGDSTLRFVTVELRG
jgi:beta-alanine degradation protein BauB